MSASFNPVTATLWLVFLAYWCAAAIFAKASVKNGAMWRGIAVRAALVYATVLVFQIPAVYHAASAFERTFAIGRDPLVVRLGIVTCALGLALAVWARTYLGRNWGVPMSLRAEHELVTSGPYTYLRHPVYSGILIALLGSGLAEGALSGAIFLVFCPYFAYCAWTEERTLSRQFPGDYLRYKQRTKMLLPFVL